MVRSLRPPEQSRQLYEPLSFQWVQKTVCIPIFPQTLRAGLNWDRRSRSGGSFFTVGRRWARFTPVDIPADSAFPFFLFFSFWFCFTWIRRLQSVVAALRNRLWVAAKTACHSQRFRHWGKKLLFRSVSNSNVTHRGKRFKREFRDCLVELSHYFQQRV